MKIYFAVLAVRGNDGKLLGAPTPVFGPYFNHGQCESKVEELSRDAAFLESQKAILRAMIRADFTLTTEMRCAA